MGEVTISSKFQIVILREVRKQLGLKAGQKLKDIVPAIIQADEVVVNITGGTTAMQHIVQQIAALAAELGRSVRRVALVDRRLPQEQREEPYVPGELIRLDRERRE